MTEDQKWMLKFLLFWIAMFLVGISPMLFVWWWFF